MKAELVKKEGNKVTLKITVDNNKFEEAVNKAKEVSKKGDVVLFSPASASFDMFKNFEERGNLFKELVNNL